MRRVAFLAIGWICVVVGAVIAPLPPPFAFGVPLLLVGLYILASNSKWTRRVLQRLRERYPGVSAKVEGWKESSIPQVRRFVRITAPQSLARLARRRAFRARLVRLRRRRGAVRAEAEPS